MLSKSLRRVALLVLAAAALSGCATSYILDNNVQSFSSMAALPAQPTYRFDRLPSQQAFQFQGQIEAMADPALFKAGLRRDDAAPNLGIQVTARVQRSPHCAAHAAPAETTARSEGPARSRAAAAGQAGTP